MKARFGISATLLVAALVALLAAATMTPIPARAVSVGFAAPILVDPVLGGGEPLVIRSFKGEDLVYTAHEGTTHLYRPGLAAAPNNFLCPGLTSPTPTQQGCYYNHVNIWWSKDHGKTWTPSNGPERLGWTGFSDPDLTEDPAGNIYNTGIDLVNDAVFSSPDGGKTWPTGTPQCHNGDRPWLAAGRVNEVFVGNEPLEGNHTVWQSTDAGASCSTTGSVHAGPSYGGYGKLVYSRVDGSIIEPELWTGGVGLGWLANAHTAVPAGTPFSTMYHLQTSLFGHFPSVALDTSGNIFFTWDTDERARTSAGGCGGTATPAPNHILLVTGKRTGPGQYSFSSPITLASPASSRVLWPWVVAGGAGNASVVWYQNDKMDDPDCGMLNAVPVNAKTYIYESHILGAFTGNPVVTPPMEVGGGKAVTSGGICQGGTTCVATGKDRRMGDFFTNAIDENGCVMIASGSTLVTQALNQPTSRPIFIQQNSGPSLTNHDCATGALLPVAADATPAPSPAATMGPMPFTGAGSPPAPAAALLSLAAVLVLGAALVAVYRRSIY